MFEARLEQGSTFKQIVDAIKDLVNDGNIDCTEDEISMQCMDSAHVSLVAMSLTSAAFSHFRCDRTLSLGFNSENMSKILKMMNKDDQLILKAEDEGDNLTLMFENEKTDTIADFGEFGSFIGAYFASTHCPLFRHHHSHPLSRFYYTPELKLMEIDTETLAIPDTPYKATVKMGSAEFQRIIRDLQVLGDTCTIAVTKEGIRFSVTGAIGTGNILLRQNASENEKQQVIVDMEEPVELNFALRYLNFFTKATPLTDQVVISMNPDVPMVVEYPIQETGYIKFYLAPKIEEDEDEE